MLRLNRILIDMDAVRHNYRLMRQSVPHHVQVMAVVKANAYGHGMLETARALEAEGAAHFAVATPDEGIELRLGGVKGEILVLGAAMPRAAEDAVAYGLTQTVFTPDMVRLIDGCAARLGCMASVHVKLDTGMNRIGLRTPQEAQAVAQALQESPHVKQTGLYTHFADADAPLPNGWANEFTLDQMKRFDALRAYFPKDICVHAANSAMSLLQPRVYHDMIREGISLYGYPPVPTELPFRPAMSWETEVVHVKDLTPGDTVSYGRTFVAQRPMRVATLAVGYGDGYHRMASGRGEVLIRGCRAPIVGRVCMDQTMVDVTGIGQVRAGDVATLLGAQGGERIDACQLADWWGTIAYEVLLSPSSRVERTYLHL